ncbi:Na+/H+ antiporter subunit G [Geomicrobium sp. JCM 19038]|uniref:Na+/H+ antiporter subunit G n=1 Tax=Geomicrobium sp. JCM 19038 TaxID=1460635 RepID=UPI0012687F8A|nr:Na+/H+ antiporter subunit G [Geomicrobium sp. JCM 19038]
MIEIIVAILVLIGVALALISAFGLIRLPDVYTRSHAATKSATLGVLVTIIGAFLFFGLSEGVYSVRLILGIIFVFLTAPVAGHLICRAAYRSGVSLSKESVQDDLEPILGNEEERRAKNKERHHRSS